MAAPILDGFLPLHVIGADTRTELKPGWHVMDGVRVDGPSGFVERDAHTSSRLALLSRRLTRLDEPDPQHLIALTPSSCWWLRCTAEVEGASLQLRLIEYGARRRGSDERIRLHQGACAVEVFTASDHIGLALGFHCSGLARFRISDLRLVEARRAATLSTCVLCQQPTTRSALVPVDEGDAPRRGRWMCPTCLRLPLAEQKHRLLLHALAGDDVCCPVCDRTFRTFLPWGLKHDRPRSNARCPSCGSLERHRLLWLYFNRRPDLLQGPARLLHVAPEACSYERLKRLEHLTYVPCDLHMPGYRYGEDVMNVDITDAPFPDASFDAIICNHVLEHVTDDRQALGEIARLLTPGGWAVIMVPVRSGLAVTLEDPAIDTPEARAVAYGQWDHVRAYGRDYRNRFLDAGLVPDETDMPDLRSRLTQFRYGLNEHDVCLWRKPAS